MPEPKNDEAPDLIDTVAAPDPELDAGKNVEEIGEPFEGNNA